MESVTDIALETSVFRSVPADRVRPLLEKGSIRKVRRGASIHMQGDAANSLCIVLDGLVKLYRMSPCGGEAVIGVLGRHESFGENAIFPGEVYPTSAECVSETRLIQIDARDLWQVVRQDNELCRALLSASFKAQNALVLELERLKSQTGAQRIAEFLLGLCQTEVGGCTVVLPYDKVLIAARLGMKPESLSRSFRRLAPYGVRVAKTRVAIASVTRLKEFIDEDPSCAWGAKVG